MRARQPKRDTTLFMPPDPRQGDRVVKAYAGGERQGFVFLDGVWAMETSPFEESHPHRTRRTLERVKGGAWIEFVA